MYSLRNRIASPAVTLLTLAALCIAMLGVAWWLLVSNKNGPLLRDQTSEAVLKDVQPKIVEHGTLEVCENYDVKCEVKPNARCCYRVDWVVDNGSQVKKGDLIVEIDASYLREQAPAAKIKRGEVRAEVVGAKKLLDLKRKSEDDVTAAETELEFKRGTLVQQEALYKGLIDQIGKCRIRAPATGIVVYHVFEPGRHAWGPSVITQGEPVQYGQTLLSIQAHRVN